MAAVDCILQCAQRSTAGEDATALCGSGRSSRGRIFEDGSARGTGGASVAGALARRGADVGRVSAFGWETIAGKASWRGSDDYVSASLAGFCMYMHVCVRSTGTAHDARRHVTSPGFRGSPRAQRESRYSPSSKGVRGPSGLRPARPAVNIHSFMCRTALCALCGAHAPLDLRRHISNCAFAFLVFF